ncbi:hypothetical protein APSETT445_001261 [Aspergillus pseudonomiae]
MDLRDVLDTINGPLIFGRADLGSRYPVYDKEEATQNRFYQMPSPQGLKHDVLQSIRNISTRVNAGDRVLLVFIAHGEEETANLQLYTRGRQAFLSNAEVMSAIRTLPPNVRLNIVNEACYSGAWTAIAENANRRQDVLVEAASRHDQEAYFYSSPSLKYRCSLFAVAYLRELSTYPEGRIVEHHRRIKEELEFVAPDQDSNTPVMGTSRRDLKYYDISHFILSPNIATAIMNVASDQDRHESTLRERTRARSIWATQRRLTSTGSASAGSASATTSMDSDMELVILREYWENLGSQGAALNRAPLATACQTVLEGGGIKLNIKKRAVRTIAWQETQLIWIEKLLQHLVSIGLIAYLPDSDTARESLTEYRIEIVQPLARRLLELPLVQSLMSPNWDHGYLGVPFHDGFKRLVDVLACNRLLLPSKFNLDRIETAIIEYHDRSPFSVETICGVDIG